MVKVYANNVMDNEQYQKHKEENKKKVFLRKRGILKGLGFNLIIWIICVAALVMIWIVGVESFSQVIAVIGGISTHSTTITHLNTLLKVLEFSLFFIVIVGFFWVYKT